MKTLLRFIINPNAWAYGLFWSWNIIFVTFMILGFAPQVLPELVNAVTTGTIPMFFLLVGIALTLIPLIAIGLAIMFLRSSPGKLFALAYGIEWPLMFMLALRFFILRDANSGVAFLMTIALLGMATLLWQILDHKIDARGAPLTILCAIGLTLLLIAFLYGAIWVSFYALPVGAEVWKALVQFVQNIGEIFRYWDWRNFFALTWAVPFAILGGLLTGYSATLFFVAPVAVTILAMREWWRGMSTLAAKIGMPRAAAIAGVVLAISAVLFVWTNQQPQRTAFTLLKNPPASLDDARQLMRQEDTLRTGLLNTYLAPFRYISSVGEVRHVRDMYHYSLRISVEDAAQVQSLYEIVARPFLYEPINPPQANSWDGRALREEPTEAAKLYKAYFDERIIDGEHDLIANTVRATWSATQAEAALQAVDDREILLTRQEINIIEHGDWAEIELYEAYQNQTMQRQEVVYYFSLPESAVVTGVWLGGTNDRATRFAYRIAPRGAAQATYRNEVRRNVDPALVEQIGPRQYRLRVFPIEPRRWQPDRTLGDAPTMHVWLTFRVLANHQTWTLPRLAEKRNVFWNEKSVRLVNGKPMQVDAQAWLPASIPASSPTTPVVHRVDFASGESVIVRPMASNDLPPLRDNLRIAVVLDRSRSMAKYSAEVKTTLARLTKFANADTYLTASNYRGEPASRVKLSALDTNRIEYIGGQNAGELLAQFEALRAGETYDAIIVITDGSGYELGESAVKPPIPNAPVWMVHLGGALPLGYDDATLEAIQASGGGVTGNIDDVLNRIAVSTNRGLIAANDVPAGATADWVDGYAWFVSTTRGKPGSAAPVLIDDDGFAAFAARRVILDAMYRERANLRQLSTLDQLHAIATKNNIVTPFSSMIVLVNTQQEQLLQALEARGDRFEREVEEVGETLGQNALSVTGVPEPHEWLLIALAAAMLAGYAYKTRMATQSAR